MQERPLLGEKGARMKDLLKCIGALAVGAVFLVALVCLGLLFIFGGIWLSAKVMPILAVVSGYTFLACVFVLVPMAVFHTTRAIAGIGLFIASYIFGLSLWMCGLLLSYSLWGFWGAFIGLFVAGIGVVPVAMLATQFSGLWGGLFSLVLLTFATYGTRIMSLYFLEQYDQQAAIAAASAVERQPAL
jgi:hypothetical protein